jgi:D-arabinose 1-dehydrogenase-like Zn-dependent alcohol dehydrogenase
MFNRQACLTSEKHPLEIKKSLLSDRLPPRACLIQVQACGLCHTDLHLQDNGYILGTDVDGKQQILRFTERGVSYPLTPGHEIVGKVYQLGAAVDPCTARVGDTVLVYPWIGCGTCDRCLAGNENLCDRNEAKDIGFDIPGGFADFVLVPDAKYLIRLNSQEIANPSLLAVLACRYFSSSLEDIFDPMPESNQDFSCIRLRLGYYINGRPESCPEGATEVFGNSWLRRVGNDGGATRLHSLTRNNNYLR